MKAFWFHVLPIAAAALCMVTSFHVESREASGQDGHPFCGPSFPNNAPSDPRLSVLIAPQIAVKTVDDDAAHSRRPVDEIQISWSVDLLALGADCIWIGRSDSAAGSPGIAEARVPSSARSITLLASGTPSGVSTLICFRLVPMSRTGIGSPSQVCTNVTNPRLPIPPPVEDLGPAPGPPNAGFGLSGSGGGSAWLLGFLVVSGTIAAALGLRAVVSGRR